VVPEQVRKDPVSERKKDGSPLTHGEVGGMMQVVGNTMCWGKTEEEKTEPGDQ